MRERQSKVVLPIGRTARLAFQIEALRADCCRAAQRLMRDGTPDEFELEECARLDDALANAQRRLKTTVAGVILARLKRRSRAGNSGR